jgi:arylsulfatase A-like enzyme
VDYPFRYGLQTIVIPGPADYGLDTSEWLLPQCLKEAGYKTAIIGKWHLGHADKKYWPKQRGFDYQYGAMKRKRHSPEEITKKLLAAEEATAGGKTVEEAYRVAITSTVKPLRYPVSGSVMSTG